MGKIWMPGGGGGGADVSVVTATSTDVINGKVIVGPDGEPITGTLTLSGNATDAEVLANKTYYNTDAKTKRTGTMPSIGSTDQSKSVAWGAASGDNDAYVRMSNGAHVTNAASGYPEIRVPGQVKTATPGASAQTISPDANKVLRSVTVNAIPSKYKDASSATINNNNQLLKDVKAIGSNGTLYTGTIESMNGQTITPSASQQTVNCSGKKMNGNVVVNAIPENYRPYVYGKQTLGGAATKFSLPVNKNAPYNVYAIKWKYAVAASNVKKWICRF